VSFDVIVIGLGAAGSAAARHLAHRGQRVLGFDRHGVPNDLGSSHGQSRVIRTAYFEDPAYVPLLRRAWKLWEELEAETGRALLQRTGALNIGPADHPAIRGVREAVREHDLAHEVLDEGALAHRHPAFAPGPGDIAIFEEDAGILSPERCIAAHAESARRAGAELRESEAVIGVEATADGFEVRTGESKHHAMRLVLAAGAWLTSDALSFGRDLPLSVERQMQLWFRAPDGSDFTPGRLPVFVHFVTDRAFYGLPDVGDGVKVCRHHGGEAASPDDLDRPLREADVQDVRDYLRAHMGALDGEPIDSRACMYTNTPDDHFLVGPHPGHPKAVLLGGFSGHGFKLASVMGEIAADLAIEGRTAHRTALFAPSRFT